LSGIDSDVHVPASTNLADSERAVALRMHRDSCDWQVPKGAAGVAAGGAAIGAIAGDAGKGAAIGATVGAVAGRRKQRTKEEQAKQQAAQQTAQAQQNTQAQAQAQQANASDTFKRSFSACMDARGYSVK